MGTNKVHNEKINNITSIISNTNIMERKSLNKKKVTRAFYGGRPIFDRKSWEDYCNKENISDVSVSEYYLGIKDIEITPKFATYIIEEMLYDFIDNDCIILYKNSKYNAFSQKINKKITDYDRFKIKFKGNVNIKNGGIDKWNVYSLVDIKRGKVLSKYEYPVSEIPIDNCMVMSLVKRRKNNKLAMFGWEHPILIIENLLYNVGAYGY